MHHIQRKILAKLSQATSLGYAQLRPAGIESNHFAYHLDQLIRDKLIAKHDHGYQLTEVGLQLIDRASYPAVEVRTQPHIATSVWVTSGDGRLLLYRHAFQPYLGRLGTPQGRLHYQEHVAQAAARELLEKTGLQDVPLIHRGMVYIHTTQGSADISKFLAHIFTGHVVDTPTLAAPTERGEALWASPTEIAQSPLMPGFTDVQRLLQQPADQLFFAELEASLVAEPDAGEPRAE